jgi:hypothetical protein
MAVNVPFPFRVAAGVIAVGLDRLRTLPTDLPAISVTLAGQAVRASMRVQQELAHLAARGEEVLSTWTDTPEEHPAWAHFDDDDVVDGELVDDDASGDEGAEHRAQDSAENDAAPVDTNDQVALPHYDELTVAQVRARLRTLDEAAVAELLEYERAGRARAAFVTTLHNRLASLRSGDGAVGDGHRKRA